MWAQDIVGFAEWSNSRDPEQCFYLLEQLYSGFDKLAYRHGVFKVEVIGDCYVAVAGLFEDDDDHAMEPDQKDPPVVAAARFAVDCVESMAEQLGDAQLVECLDRVDDDATTTTTTFLATSRLQLRVGLHHSRQVTAGILRGERSRFQLFGDTGTFK